MVEKLPAPGWGTRGRTTALTFFPVAPSAAHPCPTFLLLSWKWWRNGYGVTG